MLVPANRDLAHEIHRYRNRRRRPCRLDHGRNARPRRHFRDSDRSASGLSARLSRRKTKWPRTDRALSQDRHRRRGASGSRYDGENWIARFGYLLDKRPIQQLRHPVRCAGQRHPRANFRRHESIFSKVISISAGPERQKLVLSNGEEISARLVVLANGLNVGLRHQLGIERRIVSACHSISLGFRPGSGRPHHLRFSGDDLLLGANQATGLPISRCSRSGAGCGATCLPIARSTIRGCSKCAALRRRR